MFCQIVVGPYSKISFLKEAVSRDFRPQFFSWIEPIWAPDKQAKMVLLKNLFSRRYSNSKFQKFDSAQDFAESIFLKLAL